MNSGRMKYTFTPTYGMQRRGFGKKQTERQTSTELDFMQKPTPDFDAQILGFADQNTVPQDIFCDPVPQQGSIPYQAPMMQGQGMGNLNGVPVQTIGLQNGFPMYAVEYNEQFSAMNQPITGMPMPMMPPLANTTPARQESTNSRAQGYVPPTVMHAQQAVSQMQHQPNILAQGIGYQNQNMPYNQPVFSAQQTMNQQKAPMGTYPDYQNGGQPPRQIPGKRNKPPINIDNWLKMLLYIILPVVFVLCIALPREFDIIRYLFMTVCAASAGVMWYRQSFSSSLRTGITIGYALMCIVIILMMSSGNSDLVQNGPNITAKPTPLITDDPTAESLGYQPDQAPVTTPPAETLPEETEAGQRLNTFMDNWKANRVEDMLNYVMPSWRKTQTDPAAALFIIISNRTPLEYSIESISGSANDTSRSITMSATIDKNNGSDPVRYRFVILLDNEDGNWFVDPNSLSTNDIQEAEATIVPDNLEAVFTMAPRMTVTPVPPDSTLLYYNANGGKYYHADPECSSVNSKYLPMASFTYGELNDSPYKQLLPCLKCNAPTN